MWLINSSIGRKVVMSVTGVATLGLAALAVIHIVYAFILTAQNRKARGDNRYEVATEVNPGIVEWSSKNMLVLGIIICVGLLLHLWNFWYNMMFAELVGTYQQIDPADGFAWIKETFSNPVFVVLYIIWLVAIWFHRPLAGAVRRGSAVGR